MKRGLLLCIVISLFAVWKPPCFAAQTAVKLSDLEKSSRKDSRFVANNLRNDKSDVHQYKDDEIIVKFREKVPVEKRQQLHQRHGAREIKEFRNQKTHHLKLNGGMTVKDAVELYRNDPDVEYAEPNFIYTIQRTPDDIKFSELWGLLNTGQNGGTPGADIKATTAWDISTGSSDNVVAIIDSGIDYTHPDLVANLWVNVGIDTANQDSDPFDDNGHGTHVAGTIGAIGNNGTGVAGVNWNVKLTACKFLSASGSGTLDNALQCLDYIKSLKDAGANIVATNNSWGGGAFSQALYDAINAQQDILFIAAAGNNGTDSDNKPSYPASYDLPNIISVSATDRNDNKATFSNYGRRTVHVSAPGVGIYSTLPAVNEWGIPGGYGLLSGTSMAAPHATGLAALIKAQFPAMDWKGIKNLILSGADSVPNMYERTITGKRIDAYNSLTCSERMLFSILKKPSSISVGTPVTLSVMSINCSAPSGPVTVTNSNGDVLMLADDGLGLDQVGGDGVFTATWTPTRSLEVLVFSSPAGREVIEFPALGIVTRSVGINVGSPCRQSLLGSGGHFPYTWSVVSGSLPPGMTLNGSTGELSGSATTEGSYQLTVQLLDSHGAKALQDLLISVYPPGIQVEWSVTSDSNSFTNVYVDYLVGNLVDIAVDGDGNSYLIREGYFLNGQNVWESCAYLFKYDPAGNLLWYKNPAGIPSAIALDREGALYLGGMSCTWSSTACSYDKYLLSKFDPDGNLLWSRQRPGNEVTDVSTDKQGNIYISGTYSTSTNDIVIVKYDSSGNELWTGTAKSTSTRVLSNPYIAVDLNDNVYITGNAANTAAPGIVNYDQLLLKFDASGKELWLKTDDSGGKETGQDVAVDRNGNVYVTGWSIASPAVQLLTKFDQNGNVLWKRSHVEGIGSKGFGLAVDENAVYVTGSLLGSPYKPTDFLVSKYDFSGNMLWGMTYDAGGSERGERLTLDPNGNIFVTGSSGDVDNVYLKALTVKFNDSLALAVTASGTLPEGVSGAPYDTALSARGGTPPYSWSVSSGAIPAGLTMDPVTGVISGIINGSGKVQFDVRVSDATGMTASKQMSVTILGINSQSFVPATNGTDYKLVITGSGGTSPYSWSLVSGALPPGLVFEGSTDSSVIKGVPTETGIYSFTLQLQDSSGRTTSKQFSITVADPVCVAYPARTPRTPIAYYNSMQSALNDVVDEVMHVQGVDIYESILLDRGINLKLWGGYNCYFNDNSLQTKVHGSLVIVNGVVELNNIVLLP
ncbi:thermophilic serine proteinase [Geobacter sp. OR-1]|uniref:S8 family serine peptidase n=1 Tax=Geobacter sp. OR-1 TaxID=1266765 RepID=UPI000542AD8A|nr:S8 family serine peptidase [Geobacter sp. OR-1]GAM07954.1 thermophilic serine proteinase [Geobacter sp. OR-1]